VHLVEVHLVEFLGFWFFSGRVLGRYGPGTVWASLLHLPHALAETGHSNMQLRWA
jgi:hypothetical protein